ncbi:unnamed protein product [Urochloa humidicola]
MTTKNSSATGMSTGRMPGLGGSPAGQTPYQVEKKEPYSEAAPSHIGMHTTPPDTKNGSTSKTSQPLYQPEKRDNKTGKKHAAYGTSRDVKYY